MIKSGKTFQSRVRGSSTVIGRQLTIVICGLFFLVMMTAAPANAQNDQDTASTQSEASDSGDEGRVTDDDRASTEVTQAGDDEADDSSTGTKRNWKVYLAVGLLVVIGLIVIVALGTTAARASGDTPGRVDIEDERTSLGERMKAELSVLHRKIIEGDYRDLHEKANKWCKSLLAGMAGDPALRQASLPELRKHFESAGEIDEDFSQLVFSVLERCDQVKFSDSIPTPEEQNQLYQDCLTLLDKALTQLAARPRENAEQGQFL